MRLIVFSLLTIGLIAGCTGSRNLKDNGLSYLRLGDPMPPSGIMRLKGRAVRDTMYNQESFVWRASVIRYPQGRVYVEEDFMGQGNVNRIRIQTPELRIQKQFHVGMTFADLLAANEDWDVAWLSDYQLLDVISIDHPSVHYLLRDKGKPEGYFNQEKISTSDVSSDAEIVAIVIM
ncbi:MAG: hypothetical protein R3C61_06330 [Bacteroidia bacterium]